MSNDFSRQRLRNPLRLMVHRADPVPEGDSELAGATPPLPQWAHALLAGLAAGVAGWLVVCLIVVINWFASLSGEIGPVFGAATQLWLLAHGGGLQIGAVNWTLVPLGLSALLLLLVGGLTSGMVQSFTQAGPLQRSQLLRLLALMVGAYALVTALTALTFGSLEQAGRSFLGAALLAAVGSLWGAGRVVDLALVKLLPEWARVVPAAAVAALWTVLVGAAAVLATSLVLHHERISAIAHGLGADGGSMVQLVVAQVAFWPNLLIWSASWILGAGFTMGDGTIVSPPATDIGLVPSIPVLGALPAGAPGQWALLWLAVGVGAGIIAGLVVLRRRPALRVDEAAGVSFLAGLGGLALLALLALVSRGNLGEARLIGLGPLMPELLLLGAPLLALPATATGLVGVVVRRLRMRRAERVDGLQSSAQEGEDRSDGRTGSEEAAEPTLVNFRRPASGARASQPADGDEPTVSAVGDDEPTIVSGR